MPWQFGFFAGDTVDVAFSAAVNEYKGERSASLQIKGMRVSGADQRAMAAGRQAYERYLRNEPGQNVTCPTRDEMAVVFRFLKKQGRFSFLPAEIYAHLAQSGSFQGPDYAQFRIAVDVFLELGILVCPQEGFLQANPETQRVNLESSFILRSLLKQP